MSEDMQIKGSKASSLLRRLFKLASIVCLVVCVALMDSGCGMTQALGEEVVRLDVLDLKDVSPDVMAKSANALIALGRDKATAFLRGSAKRDPTAANYSRINERIGWLCRLVFEPAPEKQLRAPFFGGLELPYHTMPLKEWPQFPLAVSDGVIFVLAEGYTLAGEPEDPWHYIEYCKENGHFREQQFNVPKRADAQHALKSLLASERWKKIEWIHRDPDDFYKLSEGREVRFLQSQVDQNKE
jgi:hypothetical protein